MADQANEDGKKKIPALFATIHFRSPQRPDGYTDEDIRHMNELANSKSETREENDSESDNED